MEDSRGKETIFQDFDNNDVNQSTKIKDWFD